MELGHEEELGGVEVVPVTKFMRDDGFDLFGFSLLDQCVKNDNVFAPRKSEKVSIGMRTSLRAVDLVKVLKRELELGCEDLDASPEFAMWEGREFVEEGLDDSWIKDYHRKLEDK